MLRVRRRVLFKLILRLKKVLPWRVNHDYHHISPLTRDYHHLTTHPGTESVDVGGAVCGRGVDGGRVGARGAVGRGADQAGGRAEQHCDGQVFLGVFEWKIKSSPRKYVPKFLTWKVALVKCTFSLFSHAQRKEADGFLE